MTMRRSASARGLPWAVLLLLAPAPVRAFSDPLSFADAVELGGGGGRFFTGSPADGYTCAVCHAGAEASALEITGLPLAGYVPGTAYEVTVAWPAHVEHVGLALEITDREGRAAGGLRLPPADELPDAERCEPFDAASPAGMLSDVAERTVLSVPDCGARRVRFLWTAPEHGRGTVWFAGGFVRSDGEADDRGDGVTEFAHVIAPDSAPPAPRASIRADCGIAGGASAANAAWTAPASLALALALLCVRRRAVHASDAGGGQVNN